LAPSLPIPPSEFMAMFKLSDPANGEMRLYLKFEGSCSGRKQKSPIVTYRTKWMVEQGEIGPRIHYSTFTLSRDSHIPPPRHHNVMSFRGLQTRAQSAY
jgi:hypothetical protein